MLQPVMVLALDDLALFGPLHSSQMLHGSVEALRQPDGIIVDKYSCDQLWAEAVCRYQAGEKWWPGKGEEFSPHKEQEGRSDTAENDLWFEPISDWLKRQNKNDFNGSEVLNGALGIATQQMEMKDAKRLGAILRKLGYKSGAVRVPGHEGPIRRWRAKSTSNRRDGTL